MGRLALLGSLILIAINASQIRSRIDDWRGIEADPRVDAAIKLRCDSGPAPLRADCAQELEREFASEVRSPEAILRRHCTRFANEWTAGVEQPAPICDELYGGWIEG